MGKMTDEAKENMIMGQKAMRAVEAYLVYINQYKTRGRPMSQAALSGKIIEETNLAKKVILIAQMHEAIRRAEWAQKEAELKQEFLKYAPWFSEQHGVTYPAWREIGVSASVLAEAGITG
jgi:hypothetical protein